MTTVAEWLKHKYLQWQLSIGDRRSISQFAEYLGVPQPSLSEWMGNKYLPRGTSVAKIAEKLGYEVYDVLGISRPLPKDLNPNMVDLIKAVGQLPEGVQKRVLAAVQETIPIVEGENITSNEQIMWVLTDALRNHLDPSTKPEMIASALTGSPKIAYPVGVIFNFAKTRENVNRFKETGIEAAKKIDMLGLDEDSEEGQKMILQVFLDAGFPLLNTAGMNFDDPEDPQIRE